jgi:DNA modification methylase
MLPAPYYQRGDVTLYHGDCLELLPLIEAGSVDAVVTDPPYGMKKADWDECIPAWLPLIGGIPCACFCGVRGMRDYPPADWTGAWVRLASSQRCGKLRGFNNWEPILFYGIESLSNDVIATPNFHDDHGHPSEKPTELMRQLVARIAAETILDPFFGSGTTAVACVRTGRRCVGIEIEEKYCEIAAKRIDRELDQGRLFKPEPARERQLELIA